MREALARFGTRRHRLHLRLGGGLGAAADPVPHLMLIDYAFHANPGAIDKGLAPEGWTLLLVPAAVRPQAMISPSSTFVRTLLTSARDHRTGARGLLSDRLLPGEGRHAQMAQHPDALPAGAVLGQRGAARLRLADADGAPGTDQPGWPSGLGFEPIDFFNYELPVLDANIALFVGLIYSYILFMVFPMFSAMESLDTNQIEAARDLGASWARVHRQDRDPACQARHRLGLHRHLHAYRRLLHRAGAARRHVQLLVHPGDRIAVLGAELERRLGLCARCSSWSAWSSSWS